MARVQGIVVDTRRPLVVLSRNKMPVNLGRAGYEDSPENPFPALPYDAENVLPTPLGYKSAFAPTPLWREYEEGPEPEPPGTGLDNATFQDIFTYQTITGWKITVGLSEGGFWLYNHSAEIVSTNDPDIDHSIDYWKRVATVFEETGIKFLWTRCTIDNRVFCYHQGDSSIHVLVDYADYLQWKDLPGTEVLFESEFYQMAVLRRTFNFLNPEGQVGIFKADNRLGFWDTDNSVAWSNALDKFDFTPSATTFAGSTKFSSVAGNITMIKQHGRGFVIYSTASITLITPANTNERWTSTPVFSQLGVLYDTQVTLAADDTTHFFWASTGGIYKLSNGKAEVYEPELSNFFKGEGRIVSLKMLCGTHLFVELTGWDIVDSGANRYGRLVFDGAGNPLIINPAPRYTDPSFTKGFPYSWVTYAGGGIPDIDLVDYEPIEGVQLPSPSAGEALIPCYTGWTFVLPGGISDVSEITWDATSNEEFDVSSWPEIPGYTFYHADEGKFTSYKAISAERCTRFNPDTSFLSYEAGPIVSPPGARFIDKAGLDYHEILVKAIDDLVALRNRFQDLLLARADIGTDFTPPDPLSNKVFLRVKVDVLPFPGVHPRPIPTPPDPRPTYSTPSDTYMIPNVIVDVEMQVEEDGCVQKIIAYVADYVVNKDRVMWVEDEQVEGDFNCANPEQNDPDKFTYYAHCPRLYFFELGTSAIFEEVPGSRREVVVFQCEVSGFGYFPYGGFSFRKTHSRSIFKPCEPVHKPRSVFIMGDAKTELEEIEPDIVLVNYTYDSSTNYDPGSNFSRLTTQSYGQWYPSTPGYPDMRPIFANFGKGIMSPYYPIYIRSYVKDLALDKWGVYSDAHTLLFDLIPANRTEGTTFQGNLTYYTQDVLNMGAVYTYTHADGNDENSWLAGKPVVLMPFNNWSKIAYGKIGLSRAGYTDIIGASFNIGLRNYDAGSPYNLSTNVTIAGSLNNLNFTDDLQAGPENFSNSRTFNLTQSQNVNIPFTVTGRWITIFLQGCFDISDIVLYGKRVGRVRFEPPPPEA